MKNAALIFTGVFLFLCAVLCAGIWFSITELHDLREEYDQLNAEHVNSTGTIVNLEERNANLRRIYALSVNKAAPVADALAFFSMVRQIMERHEISLLYVASSGQTSEETKDNILQVKIDGDYYAIAKMLADVRDLPVASRITKLSIKRNHNLPEELVEADITFEVMTEE